MQKRSTDYGRSRQLTDAELREASLTIGDPEEQPGLVRRAPANVDGFQILNAYLAARKCHCAICGRDIHARGFTVELPGGTRFLAGKDCGKKFLGETWERAVADHEHTIRRKRRLLQRDDFRRHLPRIIEAVEAWRWPLGKVERWLNEWRDADPSVFTALGSRRDGKLRVRRKALNVAAIAGAAFTQRQRDDGSDPAEKNADETPMVDIEEDIGTLPCPAIFQATPGFERMLALVVQGLNAAFAACEPSQPLTKFNGAKQRMERALTCLRDARALYDGVRQTLEPAHTTAIARYLLDRDTGRYAFAGRRIERLSPPPYELSFPPLPLLNSQADGGLQDLLNGPMAKRDAA